jgi:hypothetical protein
MGDLIIRRRNDSTMRIAQAEHDVPAADQVRNGNRWQVAAVDADRNRIAAGRLSDEPAPSSTATICVSTSPTGMPPRCTRPGPSPPTPATPCCAKRRPAQRFT